MDGGGGGGYNAEQSEALLQQVRGEVQAAAFQELFTKISEKCFQKCLKKPGSSLSSSDQKCLAMCMDRYMDTMNVVSKTVVRRNDRS